MTEYHAIQDVPGLHFTPKEGFESNVKYDGDVNANPDVALVTSDGLQTVMKDELGFLWRTKTEDLNVVRTARVVGLSLPDKLTTTAPALLKQTGLRAGTKAIFVVKHGDKLLDEHGKDVPMTEVQSALWLSASGIASVSKAKVALRKLFDINPKGWHGHVHATDDLELVRLLLTDDVEIVTQ